MLFSKKFLFILSCIILSIGGAVFYKKNTSQIDEAVITIGILQTASHPALDLARDGFMKELSLALKGKVHFVIQNAEGSLPQAQSIAESFHTHAHIKAIYAIGTAALQAAAKVEKEKPIFMAAISDLESLGILHSKTNVCGTTDQVNTEDQVDLLLELFPEVKKISIIYNPGEHNSQTMVSKMQKSLQNKDLTPLIFGVHSESEIAQTILLASRKGEIILVPTDNLMASAMPLVSKEALKRNIPLFVSDVTLVEQGALVAQGVNYFDLGKRSAVIAHKVLVEGLTPQQVGIEHPTDSTIVMNKKTMHSLKIILDEDLLHKITLVEPTVGGSHAS